MLLPLTPAAAQVPLAQPGQPGWERAAPACFIWNDAPDPARKARWTGQCSNARANGTGRLEWRIGDEIEQEYRGPMRDGRPEGKGELTWPDGHHYIGLFQQGRIEGQGMMIWPNGDRYLGNFVNGERHGRGVLQAADGGRQEGDWRHDKLTGRGVRNVGETGRYSGEMRDGIPDGPGIYTGLEGVFGGWWSDGCYDDGIKRFAVGVVPSLCP